MTRQHLWLRAALALATVWALAWAGIALSRSQRVTAEKTMAFVAAHPLTDLDSAARARVIDDLAALVNRLTPEERQKFRYQRELREWFEALTDDERARYLDLTLPKGVQQMMEAFNKMDATGRRRLVNRALADLERFRADVPDGNLAAALADRHVQRIIDEGMKGFLTEANAAVKIDLQPLIEQMQMLLQQGVR